VIALRKHDVATRHAHGSPQKGGKTMIGKKLAGLFLAIVVGFLSQGASAQEKQAFLWDGSQWTQLSFDAKVGFVKGVGNLADFEVASGAVGRIACFSRVLVSDLKEKTVGQIVQDIDKFYQENPGKLSMSVIEVVMRRSTKLCPPETAAKEGKK
jgi:hypothetical protein